MSNTETNPGRAVRTGNVRGRDAQGHRKGDAYTAKMSKNKTSRWQKVAVRGPRCRGQTGWYLRANTQTRVPRSKGDHVKEEEGLIKLRV